MKDQELITIEQTKALEAFQTGDGLDEIVQRAKDAVFNFEHDLGTKNGRARTASLAHRVARLKVQLDDMGKGLVVEWKRKSALVDNNRRQMREDLDMLKMKARAPLSDWEASEEWRITNIQNAITAIKDLALFDHDPTIKELGENLDNAMAQTIDEYYEEFEEQARNTKQATIEKLELMIEAEENRLELDRLRAEKQEREQRELEEQRQRDREELEKQLKQQKEEREERLKQQAEEKARKEAELRIEAEKAAHAQRLRKAEEARRWAIAKAQEAENNARKEREEFIATQARLEAEKKAVEKSARLEEQRKLEEKTRKAEEAQRKKEKNRSHVNRVQRQAAEYINSFIELEYKNTMEASRTLVKAIHDGRIKNVKIEY